jgi:hypothetical protein
MSHNDYNRSVQLENKNTGRESQGAFKSFITSKWIIFTIIIASRESKKKVNYERLISLWPYKENKKLRD